MSITQRGNTNLPGEVRFDSAGQVLKAWAMVDGALVTPTSATVTLYSPGGAVLVAATSATVSGSELTYTLDASDEGTWVLDEGYTARWDYTIASVDRVQEHLFDVVLRPLLANIPVTVDDLKNADPSIDAMLSQSAQSTDAHQRYIQSAWVDVYAWIKSKGRRPWLIADSRVLYRVTKARALELLCRSSMMSPGDKYGFLAEVYEKELVQAKIETVLEYTDVGGRAAFKERGWQQPELSTGPDHNAASAHSYLDRPVRTYRFPVT